MDENTKESIVYWFRQIGKEQVAIEFFNAIPNALEKINAREEELEGKKLSGMEDKKQANRVLGVLLKTKQELERLK